MVERRDGDEIDLLTSSIRTTGGALISAPLYVLSGLVYAVVTSTAATGTFFFLTVGVALLLRPVRGVSGALQKIGSEPGERVEPYLGLTLLGTAGYLLALAAVVVPLAGPIDRLTAFDAALLDPVGAYAVSVALSAVVTRLIAAVGYPGAVTWLSGGQSAVRLAAVLALAPTLTTAGDLLVVAAAVRVAFLLPTAAYLRVVPTLPDRHAARRTWTFARWSVPDQVLDRFTYNMPVYVLGVVATPAAVGIYETADRFADFGATISWHLSTPLLTKVSGDDAAGRALPYLDAAITGGTGVAVAVLGYLLAAHDIVARIAFADAPGVFSTTVLIVGGVNVCRGFWMLASHAMEGLGKPSVSFRTKLAGLAVGGPITAVFGAAHGAVAGAVGYGVLNIVVFASVANHARAVVGRVPIDRRLAAHLGLGLIAAFGTTATAVVGLERVVSPALVAVLAAAACLAGFLGVMLAVSAPTRRVVDRTLELSRGRLRSLVGRVAG
ncbi:transporter [Halobacteriales archaeon SW_7_68_16]|nr:MAG: transporter [Halobacteriales archaeon SW_7_68_16]